MRKPTKKPPSSRTAAAGGAPRSQGGARDRLLLFVDAVEAGHARLLLGEEAFTVPARLLPRGTREGAWLRLSLEPAPAPEDVDDDEAAAIRARLSADDDGGDIKL